MNTPRRRRAIMLVELLSVLIPAAILLGLLAMMTVDFIKLQQLAGQHAGRMTLADSLCARMRTDIVSAGRADWTTTEDGTGILSLHSPDEPGITYRIESERVTRSVAGVEDNVWSAARLQFECSCLSGRAGRLLRLTLEELPPPGRSVLPSRRFVTTFVLPVESTGPQGDRE
jgi:hypothetical protein